MIRDAIEILLMSVLLTVVSFLPRHYRDWKEKRDARARSGADRS